MTRLLPQKKTTILLWGIVLAAILIRTFFLWIGRPEFVGWFNHTYYYFVETRGILDNGTLPYPDMPLLFYLYAVTAKILSWGGMEVNRAIVSSTRFWMCILPSLIPVPVYLTFKNIYRNPSLNWRVWALTGISAFLPLTLLHLPEFSQKNIFGILLMALLMYQSRELLEHYNIKKLGGAIIIFLLIVLTHFGTTGAAVLFMISLVSAVLVQKKDLKLKFSVIFIGVLLPLITIGLVYVLDVQRFNRIFYYLKGSFHASFIGTLFLPEAEMTEKLMVITGVLASIFLIGFFYSIFRRNSSKISFADKIFWLGNILFSFLLILPVYDQLLMARFVLFLSLPMLIVISYIFEYGSWRNRIKNGLTLVLVLGTLLMGFGEYMSRQMHNQNKEQVFEQFTTMKNSTAFTENDLILTVNGAEHLSNWFLGTKSGVITAFNRNDFKKYDNIYLCNPIEGQLNFTNIEGKRADNERDRYLFMMRNIPRPENAVTIFESEFIQLLKIEEAPKEWEYDAEGNWVGYGEKG